MSSPAECHFSESHEWYTVDGDVATVGISQFAANELTDITYVEMQPVGTSVQSGDSMGEVESVKTTSDVISAFAGEVIDKVEIEELRAYLEEAFLTSLPSHRFEF